MIGDDSASYRLAEEGYDVWLGNNRGTKHTRRHIHLDADKDNERFFDFSFEDLALYDLPAIINFVRNHTGVEKLSYIAHS